MATDIDLNTLSNGVDNLTPEFGAALAQASSVCLDSEGHASPATLAYVCTTETAFSLVFPAPTDPARATWADPEEATEYGATGIALLIAREELGLKVIQRSAKGKGHDWYLSDSTEDLFDEGKCTRLEISGIRRGDNAKISGRLQTKLDQVNKGSYLGTPGYAAVVEFSCPKAVFEVAQ